MSRRPATISQADVARKLRAARQIGAHSAELAPDGTLRVFFTPSPNAPIVDAFATWEREHEQAKAAGRRHRD